MSATISTTVLSTEDFISTLESFNPIEPINKTPSMALYRDEDDKSIKLLVQSANSLSDNFLIEIEKV